MHFAAAGDIELGHTHASDHITLLAKGTLKVTIKEQSHTYTAPHMIFIKAELRHELEAVTDNTVIYCVHALRDKVGDILDPSMVPPVKELEPYLNALVNSGEPSQVAING